MRRLNRASILLGLAIGFSGTGEAQTQGSTPAALAIFDFPQAGVEFLTGDTWRVGQQTYRLYGVQSCIRGTQSTNAAGVRQDCGEASLAYTAAVIRDTRPRCTAVAQAGNPPIVYAVCTATVGRSTLDLGAILIAEGFAFAAADANGRPINLTYSVAEGDAERSRRGLWAAPDLPYPTRILMDVVRSAARR